MILIDNISGEIFELLIFENQKLYVEHEPTKENLFTLTKFTIQGISQIENLHIDDFANRFSLLGFL